MTPDQKEEFFGRIEALRTKALKVTTDEADAAATESKEEV
jgi:hypothetical protein